MRLLTLLTLTATTLAFPSPSSSPLRQLNTLTIASESCALPDPPTNCAGAQMRDVIIQISNLSESQRKTVMEAVKSSGSQIVHEYPGFGFSGFVPVPVVELIRASLDKVHVYENACAEIPWCGEAPC
ncbi:uncharacterized protein EI97DRAFT_446133 [Westerdykella ornata]|uniref:Inhibitor I9 domain-containing protein n=1 Tax=Westerdykella ornata TaxID=318751 RepID=A0A6A6J7R8_WESOR|nr:uncharacterized protein EI97DRAFT_446133 [Westerdykella ornata]KAF2272048.1 hypothetical protein EI97DRAFT_446133 [Westerdykella ornata]